MPAARLTEASSLDHFVRPIALRGAGPALGGVLIATAGVGWGFAVDAATFALWAACVMRMKPLRAPAREDEATAASALADVREGYRFVRSHVWLWGTFLGATLSYLLFMGPTEVLLPYVVKNDFGGSAQLLGIVFAMCGVGAVAAAVIVGQRGMPRRHMTLMYVVWSVATFAIAGYGLAVLPWQLMAASLAFNALETAGMVWWATTKQRLVPGALLGRVSSFDWFISIGLVPLSYAMSAPLAAAFGVRETLLAVGLIGGVTTLAFLFLPGMRDVERAGLALDEPQAAPLGVGDAMAVRA